MMEWTPALAVGVEVIDAQHRDLFAAVNALLDAIDRGDERIEVVRLMDFLEEYVANHFGTEEIYMRRYTYPGYPAHKSEHTGFISGFFDLRDELGERGVTPALTGKLSRQVCDWLIHHIGSVDKALGRYMQENRKAPRGG